jgi:hypothetical protein
MFLASALHGGYFLGQMCDRAKFHVIALTTMAAGTKVWRQGTAMWLWSA